MFLNFKNSIILFLTKVYAFLCRVIKNVDSDARPWIVKTSKAPGYNPNPNWLRYDTTAAEATNEYTDVDFLSNGFKLRQNGSYTNNTVSYIYFAFAALPYKYANAF